MLTRANLKVGEGEIDPLKLDIGIVTQRKERASENYGEEDDNSFHKDFYQMVDMVEKLFGDYQRRLEKKIKKKMSVAGST